MAPDATGTKLTAGRSPEAVDRIFVGVCGAIWLVLLAASAVAAVALVRLASGRSGGDEGDSSWLLYSVIAVSALIIVGAIPLLLRARRGARPDLSDDDYPAPAEQFRGPARPVNATTENMRVFGVDPYARRAVEPAPVAEPAIPASVWDRLFLRGSASLLATLGLALTAVAVASYLLATSVNTGAWVALGVAGVITVAMPAVLTFYQRKIADVLDEAGV